MMPRKGFSTVNTLHACLLLILLAPAGGAWGGQESRRAAIAPIAMAAYKGDIADFVRLVRQDPAAIEDRSFAGRTPLLLALSKGHNDLAWLIIRLDADVTASDMGGASAASIAAAYSSPDVLQYTIEQGAPVDSADKDGSTPLMYAVKNQRTENVAVLLRAGANKEARDNAAQSAMDLAHELDNSAERTKIIKALREHSGRAGSQR